MSRASEHFKAEMLLKFRANHRAQQRPAETLESDTAELAARIEALGRGHQQLKEGP